MTSEEECFVYVALPGEVEPVTAARFRRVVDASGLAVGRLVYGRSYLARTDAVELDPTELRLGRGTYETARLSGFFGALRDAMPDAWGRRVIERCASSPVRSEFDYLLLGPDDRAGALDFGRGPAPPAPRRAWNQAVDLGRLQRAAYDLLAEQPSADEALKRQAEELLLLGTSMGGARPKAVIEHDGALWVAKFRQASDRFNHPRVEHATLRLAAECGVGVVQTRLVTVGEGDVLLVRRFDRESTELGYTRSRMVSALTLLRGDEEATSRGRWSYLLLADELRRVSERPRDDLRELFTRVCFNAAVSNVDDHPRNHAIIAPGPGWRLSPAYDLNPTPLVSLERRDLAMICGRDGRWANRGNILSGAPRFMLSGEEAAAIFDHVAETVAARWHASLRREGVSEADCAQVASAFGYPGLCPNGDAES